jgi:hypothetical protein
MSVNRDNIMNTHKKARKDARTDQAQPHYEPTFEQIQVRAYEIYIQRGRQDGLDREDSFQAEKELKTSGAQSWSGDWAGGTSACHQG